MDEPEIDMAERIRPPEDTTLVRMEEDIKMNIPPEIDQAEFERIKEQDMEDERIAQAAIKQGIADEKAAEE